MTDGVWIPATPEPFHGATFPLLRTKLVCWEPVPDAPYGVLTPTRCNRKFKGPEAREDYEQHWHRDHAWHAGANHAQMCVTADRAAELGYVPRDLEHAVEGSDTRWKA